MKALDPFKINIEKTTLIEASAGTGKTYTIATLYCRMVAMGYPVESILVVTFTEAAAAELKLRIRTRLFNTLAGLSKKKCDTKDDLIRFLSVSDDRALICQRLNMALICFDQTAVMTIHAFCLKALKENAFESHTLFDIELVPDRSLFFNQVSFDFFMDHVNTLDPLFLSFLNQNQISPQQFIKSFNPVISRPGIFLKPFVTVFEDVFDEYRQCIKKIQDILSYRAGEITEVIFNHSGIDKRSYSKKNVPAWLESSLMKIENQGLNTFFKMTEKGDALFKFTQTRLKLKTKPDALPPDHEFFDLCEHLLIFYQVFENNLIYLKIKFLRYFAQKLETMKLSQGKCFFDDLVNDLASALENDKTKNLRKSIRQTYHACLIDEFQDTDPRQYDIFSALFSSKNTPFFMIGDPKQAIYAFRGGDIFAYLKAAEESDQRFTLKKNYRSAPLMVKGINRIFSYKSLPFLFKGIEFSKVSVPQTAVNALKENKKNIPPLQFCFIQRDDQILDRQGFIKKETAFEIIPAAVAEDIFSLVQSKKIQIKDHLLNYRRINPADIAVLVRTNRQAEQIQQALSRLNIPSYQSTTGSVFDSRQAIDLHDILCAVADPDQKGYIKAALCTSVFNFSSEMIANLDLKKDLFYLWQDRFRVYRQIWETRGFVSMIMDLLHSKEAFLRKNLNLGERELTNFYHLIELVSQAGLNQKLSPYYLLKWYDRQQVKELRDDAADELRLESDKKAVAIVTIHKSKGMEYPVVYLPYLWEGQRQLPNQDLIFHDPEKDYALTLDFGSSDLTSSREYFENEDKAEQRRLLYVALTRASVMCKIIWGGFKSMETSALGSILHKADKTKDNILLEDLENLRAGALESIMVKLYNKSKKGLQRIKNNSAGSILAARKINRQINPAWTISSFSAITALAGQHQNLPDQAKKFSQEEKSLITLEFFPKGAGSGDFFHSIFELLDFTSSSNDIKQQVFAASTLFGFTEPEMKQMALKAVTQILETRLETGKSGFCLKDIPFEQRFNEMEFIFSVDNFLISSLQRAFELSSPQFKSSGYIDRLAHLQKRKFKGFLKGFIDLVILYQGKWYIIDYKSNYLGSTYDRYSRSAMFDAMAEHHYFLQYHLYLVALHRYLGLRLKDYEYDIHFGGVFYLFIRGMHPLFNSQYGVFFHRPKKDAIVFLSDNL